MATPATGAGVLTVRTVARHAAAWLVGPGSECLAVSPRRDVQDGRAAVRLAQGTVRADAGTDPRRASASCVPNAPRGGRSATSRPIASTSTSRAFRATTCSRSASWPGSPRPTSRRTSTASRCSIAASTARSPTPARRSTSRAGPPARLQLDPRARASERSPTGTSASSPAMRSGRAARHAQCLLDGGVGRRLQHEPRDDAPRHRQVDRTRRRQAPVDPRLPRSVVPLPDLRLPAVPQAPARRGRPARFTWADYELHALVGGEGMTEELRDILLRVFRSVYSGYGATDIEIGMAAESPGLGRAPSVARAASGRARGAVRGRLAAADGVPVQPADPLPRGQRRARGRVHGLAAWTCSRRASATTSTTRAASSPFARRPQDARGCGLRPRPPRLEPGGARTARPLPWAVRSRCRSCSSTAGATQRSASWARTSTPKTSRSVLYRDRQLVPRLHSFLLSVVDDAIGHAAAVRRARAVRPRGHRRRLARRVRRSAARWVDGAQHRLPLLDRRVPGCDAPDRRRPRRRGGPFAADATRIKQRRIVKA